MITVFSDNLDTTPIDILMDQGMLPVEVFNKCIKCVCYDDRFMRTISDLNRTNPGFSFNSHHQLIKDEGSDGYIVISYNAALQEVSRKRFYSVPRFRFDGSCDVLLTPEETSFLSLCRVNKKKLMLEELLPLCNEIRNYMHSDTQAIFDTAISALEPLSKKRRTVSFALEAGDNKVSITAYEGGIILFKATVRNGFF